MLNMTIDPGVEGTGIALWKAEDWAEITYPEYITTYTAPRAWPWVNRVLAISHDVTALTREYKIANTYIEMPEFFDTAFGEAVAKNGSLPKLCVITGAILGSLYYTSGNVLTVNPSKWKGQVSKEITEERLLRKLPELKKRWKYKLSSHAIDAVALGIWVKEHPNEFV